MDCSYDFLLLWPVDVRTESTYVSDVSAIKKKTTESLYKRPLTFSKSCFVVSGEIKKKIKINIFPLFTLGSIYGTNASGDEKIPEANNLNKK